MNIDWQQHLLRYRNRVFNWSLDFVQELFPVLLSAYLLLVLIETAFVNEVSLYLNLDYLLIPTVIAGVGAIFSFPATSGTAKPARVTFKHKFVIFCAVIGAIIIASYKLSALGLISVIIAILIGGLILFLALLAQQENQGDKVEDKDNQDN